MSDSVQPHRRQPTRLPHPWHSPGENTGVGCHCLLQCMKVKSESEVAQSCPTLHNPMDCSLPGSSIHGIFQARVLELGAIAFSERKSWTLLRSGQWREMEEISLGWKGKVCPQWRSGDLSSRGKARASLEVCGEDLVGSPVIKMRSLYRFYQGCVTWLDGSAGPQCNYQLLNLYYV